MKYRTKKIYKVISKGAESSVIDYFDSFIHSHNIGYRIYKFYKWNNVQLHNEKRKNNCYNMTDESLWGASIDPWRILSNFDPPHPLFIVVGTVYPPY